MNPPVQQRLRDFDGTFFRGSKGDCDPGSLPLGYFFNGINVLNVGGTISCRPGHRCIVKLPKGRLQGAAIFRPQLGLEQLLVGVDGAIYVATWPFKEFTLITNILMSPSAKQLYFVQTEQTAERRTSDLNSAINIIEPRNVLFIQDGGTTAPAWYDGSNSGHVRDHLYETPVGGVSVWVGDRLWVSNGTKVFASDISNPFSFRENVYLGGTTGLSFSGDVTAMTKTQSLEFPQLIVFTAHDASLVQADIRQRDLWATTVGFQKEIFKVGCVSQRSIVSHYGNLSWFSLAGVVFLDSAVASKVTARLPIRDSELLRSKTLLADDLSLVASAGFGAYRLFSVPAESLLNKHTWVLNGASFETLQDDSGPSWSGYWIGTNPVEWLYGEIAGEERIYHVSTDDDGENRLWISFLTDRLDNGCFITWAFETRGYFGQTSQTKQPGEDCKLAWADVALVGIEEDLDIGVFYAGGLRGAYKSIMAKRISVERGSLASGQEILATTNLFAFKPQIRVARTQDASEQPDEPNETGSCPVESPTNEGEDESFQLLAVFHGPGAVRYVKVEGFTVPPDSSGDPKACENEVPFNTIRFDGAGVKAESYAEAEAELALKKLDRYTANRTAAVEQGGFTAVGVGFAESIVSQDAADRCAERIATKMAEAELNGVLPPLLSYGEGL